ncbi:MAG: hypothetical protein ACREJ0_21340 [Geminicoccaceae bacterium]
MLIGNAFLPPREIFQSFKPDRQIDTPPGEVIARDLYERLKD